MRFLLNRYNSGIAPPEAGFNIKIAALVFVVLIGLLGCWSEQRGVPQPMAQYPSPMADSIRLHERIERKPVGGLSISLKNVLDKPVEIYIPDADFESRRTEVLIHFHGASYVGKFAVCHLGRPVILAVVNLGSGSSVYERAFQDESAFGRLVDSIVEAASKSKSIEIEVSGIYLSSFSAGYGAVRAILREHQAAVDGILLLDGLHTGYVPPRRVLADGGSLNTEKLEGFVEFARLATEGKKRCLITHSEIFPGTYASTTETADFIIESLNLQRRPVLKWGPAGMQLLSETEAGGLKILGFAGNTAPDHIDHLHGLATFLKMMLNNEPSE